jgi:hypothetical protein
MAAAYPLPMSLLEVDMSGGSVSSPGGDSGSSSAPVTSTLTGIGSSAPIWVGYVAIGCVMLTLFSFITAHGIPSRVAQVVDIFPTDHWVPDGTPLVKRITKRGAACTLAFFAVASAIAAVLLSQWFLSNTITTAALVPLATVAGALPVHADSCSLTVTYLDGDEAACATRRTAELVSQQFSWASVTSSTAIDVASGSNCSSRWDFSDVSIGALEGISLSQPAWLMQHVRWSMSCTSALTAGVTSLRGALTASAAQRLIGTLAVHIGGTATRTIDETGVVADHGVGVVLALQSATQGGADAGTSVTARDTVTLQWSIQVEANVLVTTLGSRQTWTQLVSGIMGAVVAALSLFRLMFKVVERFADRIIHFVLGNCGRVCGCWRSQWAARQLKTGIAKGTEMKLGSVLRAAVTNLDKSRASRVEAARAGAAAPFTGPWVSNPVMVSRRPSSQVGQSHAAADVWPGCSDPKRVNEEAMVSIR